MSDRGNHLVLVVDDHSDTRDGVAALLRTEALEVVTAVDGADALRVLRRQGHAPCAIVLDLHMPVMDGFTFRRTMQDDPALADIPVVLFTSDQARDHHGHQLQAAAVVRKDDFDGLLRAVHHHCE